MLSDVLIRVETIITRRYWLNRHLGLNPGSSAFEDSMIWIPDRPLVVRNDDFMLWVINYRLQKVIGIMN